MMAARPAPSGTARLFLYWNTLRFLAPAQFLWRLRRRLVPAHPRTVAGVSAAAPPRAWVRPCQRRTEWVSANAWSCHGVTWTVSSGSPWMPQGIPDLELYHLHYLDQLCSAAVLDKPATGTWLAEAWRADNFLVPRVAWQPYPLSRRIQNICKWRFAGGDWSAGLLASVASQADLLGRTIEYDLRGNHLIANGVALLLAGTAMDGPAARGWRLQGIRILVREAERQVLGDGGHYERSPMYHAVVLEDLLDAINAVGGIRATAAAPLVPVAQRMFAWLDAMTLPGGRIALFNDAATDGCSSPAALREYASRLGLELLPAGASNSSSHMPDSGYFRAAIGPWTLIAAVGSVGPDEQAGHAHADTFSFELAVAGRCLIVDPGTSTYVPDEMRAAERGTRAHNSVFVDGADSTEVWGSFRTARRACVSSAWAQIGAQEIAFGGRHDGYARMRPPVWHTRRWSVTADRIEIIDVIEGVGEHDVEIGFLLAPDASVVDESEVGFALSVGSTAVRLSLPPGLHSAVRPAHWAPRFGCPTPSLRLVGFTRSALPVTFRSTILFVR